jgi:excisionase family DNA binding protein
MMTDDEYLTSSQVAIMLNCHVTTVAKLVKQGKFPGTRKFNPSGRTSPYSIPRSAVEKFMQSQLVVAPDKEQIG